MAFNDLLIKTLTKRAKGYNAKEKTEEFQLVDGQLQLVKRKVVTKHIASDINAVKALLELNEIEDVTTLSDEQLQVEKLRLLNMLKVCDDVGTAKNVKENEKND